MIPTDDGTLVWHYTDGPGLVSIITRHVLWATSASFLNDQEEVALGRDLVLRRLAELADADDLALLRGWAAEIGRATGRLAEDASPGSAGVGLGSMSVFILSASESWDSLAMWRNYGGGRESYAVGLAADASLAVLGDPDVDPASYAPRWGSGIGVRSKPWAAVRYHEPGQVALVDAVVAALPEGLARFHDRLRVDYGVERLDELTAVPPEVFAELEGARADLEQALLLIKHPGFVDERETRRAVVLWTDPSHRDGTALGSRLVRYRPSGYGMAPYLELTGCPEGTKEDRLVVQRPSRLPVRAVAVSPSPNGPEATESLRGLLASRGYDGVPVLRSTIPFRG